MGNNINQRLLCFGISIIDGFFMSYLMTEVPQTFDDILLKFHNKILQVKSTRIDVVFDQYSTPSI